MNRIQPEHTIKLIDLRNGYETNLGEIDIVTDEGRCIITDLGYQLEID